MNPALGTVLILVGVIVVGSFGVYLWRFYDRVTWAKCAVEAAHETYGPDPKTWPAEARASLAWLRALAGHRKAS